jgi:hypothetical protein
MRTVDEYMRGCARLAAIGLSATALAGCASMSFAPPRVETAAKISGTYDSAGGCKSKIEVARGAQVPIRPNVIGAIDLINNYVLIYGCAADELADGRQIFEVPSFLAAATGLIGASFGLSEAGVLAAGTGAAVTKSANNYYAPKQKAALVTTALRALLCVKNEAVGISYFRTSAASQGGDSPASEDTAGENVKLLLESLSTENRLVAQMKSDDDKSAALSAMQSDLRKANSALAAIVAETPVDPPAVFIDAERQYYEMVSGALYAIHSILGERMRDAGSTDTTDVFKQLKELAGESEDADGAVDTAETDVANAQNQLAGTKNMKLMGGRATDSDVRDAKAALAKAEAKLVRLQNDALQPKLQTCVLQARV